MISCRVNHKTLKLKLRHNFFKACSFLFLLIKNQKQRLNSSKFRNKLLNITQDLAKIFEK